MSTQPSFTAALARLDARLAEAEAHVATLRNQRTTVEAFQREYMSDDVPLPPASPSAVPPTLRGEGGRPVGVKLAVTDGPTGLVLTALQAAGGSEREWTIDGALGAATAAGHVLGREQVRNALHYMVRKNIVAKVRRGVWQLKDAEAPAVTGASVGNTAPIQEGGGSREDDEEASPPAEDQHHPQLGASITEVAV